MDLFLDLKETDKFGCIEHERLSIKGRVSIVVYFPFLLPTGRPGSSTSPDKTVVVQWDSGQRTNYRVGYQDCYDLRIFDNAPIGECYLNSVKKDSFVGIA